MLASRLIKAGHPTSVTSYYGLEGNVLNWNGIVCYPKAYDPYGQDVMSANAAHFKSDILLTNMDTWVLNPANFQYGARWVAWMPVDHEPCPRIIIDKVRSAFARIVYSRFAEKELTDAGLDCYFVPMSVDTNVYKPMPKSEARTAMGTNPDTFIVGMVAMNKGKPSRKAFEPQLRAFAQFHKRHPDTALYMHTQTGANNEMDGVNLPELAAYLGISKCIQFCDQHALAVGLFQDDYMVKAYNAIDCLMAVSMGEGFGIPIVEAQACGTPVIAGDWTSMGELCFSGWKIPKKQSEAWWTPLAAYMYQPRVGPIIDALEKAYAHAREDKYRDAARAGALAYDADTVFEKYWTPTLADLDRKIKAIGVSFVGGVE